MGLTRRKVGGLADRRLLKPASNFTAKPNSISIKSRWLARARVVCPVTHIGEVTDKPAQ